MVFQAWRVCRWTEPFSLLDDKDYTVWEPRVNPCLHFVSIGCEDERINQDIRKQDLKRYTCGGTYGEGNKEFFRGINTLDANEGLIQVSCCTIPYHECALDDRRYYKIGHKKHKKLNFTFHIPGFHIAGFEKEAKDIIVHFCRIRRKRTW